MGKGKNFADFEILQQSQDVIASPGQAFDVMDFEIAARRRCPPPTSVIWPPEWMIRDGARNSEGYSRLQIRSRRLVDVRTIDMSVHLLGATWSSPIVICPVSSQKAFHPEGDIAVARAARTKDHLQILSTAATSSIEDVMAARGAPVWQQLYRRISGRSDRPS